MASSGAEIVLITQTWSPRAALMALTSAALRPAAWKAWKAWKAFPDLPADPLVSSAGSALIKVGDIHHQRDKRRLVKARAVKEQHTDQNKPISVKTYTHTHTCARSFPNVLQIVSANEFSA